MYIGLFDSAKFSWLCPLYQIKPGNSTSLEATKLPTVCPYQFWEYDPLPLRASQKS